MRRYAIICICLAVAIARTPPVSAKESANVQASWDIAEVPSWFPVGFCLLTAGERQYVAYYDAKHQMTVASRALGSDDWQYQVLPSKVGWDSHNYITMALDDDGQLHLSGNMHCVPLIYFRTTKAGDITTFERVTKMVGHKEGRCTYPQFMRGADNQLIFHYRDGSSGSGNEIYNVYNCKTGQWHRLLEKPLTDGGGKMNAYMSGPTKGPDGLFHLCWVWRDTPDCRTNHDPSYARSRDLLHWETVAGRHIQLPITLQTKGTLIDPVPAGGGIINGSLRIGFDSSKRPLASYHKFDKNGKNGKTQAYVARFEAGKWVPHQVSDWDYRWDFNGGGSIVFEIHLGAVEVHAAGKLALPYGHAKHGSGLLVLDEKTLAPLGTEKRRGSPRPRGFERVESEFPGIRVKTAGDRGQAPAGESYILRWETLPNNRDRPRKGPLPKPSKLRLYRLDSQQGR